MRLQTVSDSQPRLARLDSSERLKVRHSAAFAELDRDPTLLHYASYRNLRDLASRLTALACRGNQCEIFVGDSELRKELQIAESLAGHRCNWQNQRQGFDPNHIPLRLRSFMVWAGDQRLYHDNFSRQDLERCLAVTLEKYCQRLADGWQVTETDLRKFQSRIAGPPIKSMGRLLKQLLQAELEEFGKAINAELLYLLTSPLGRELLPENKPFSPSGKDQQKVDPLAVVAVPAGASMTYLAQLREAVRVIQQSGIDGDSGSRLCHGALHPVYEFAGRWEESFISVKCRQEAVRFLGALLRYQPALAVEVVADVESRLFELAVSPDRAYSVGVAAAQELLKAGRLKGVAAAARIVESSAEGHTGELCLRGYKNFGVPSNYRVALARAAVALLENAAFPAAERLKAKEDLLGALTQFESLAQGVAEVAPESVAAVGQLLVELDSLA